MQRKWSGTKLEYQAGGILVWQAMDRMSGAFTVMAVLVALVALGVSRLDESKEG